MDRHLHMLIEMALTEDAGKGDITSEAIIAPELHAVGRIVAKQSLVLAGIDVAKRVFETSSGDINWDPKKKDGERCETGDVIAIVQGKARALLCAERTALNFLGRLSGIATLTNLYVNTVKSFNVRILDTRKTTPALRALEKHAVLMGGGTNHRMGLYDQYLIKNNHISVAGGVSLALETARKARKPGQLIEIEARLMVDVEAAVRGGADIIMLDNMSVDDVRKAVKTVKGQAKIEVSGNITLDNIISYASTGVDFISIGALTHSAPSADINMLTMVERKAGEYSVSSLESKPSGKK